MSASAMPSAEALEAMAGEIAVWFEAVFADLLVLGSSAEHSLNSGRPADATLSVRERKGIRSATERFLERHRTPEAAGVIFSPGEFGPDGDIEWWERQGDGSTSRVLFTLTPQSAGFYDFSSLEWFRNVVETGLRTLTGPYVDYAGMDQYILTLTVPLRFRERIIGVAGCDIELRALETAIMPILRRHRADIALISFTERIILGNSGRFLVGNRLHGDTSMFLRVEVPVAALGLTLIATPRGQF